MSILEALFLILAELVFVLIVLIMKIMPFILVALGIFTLWLLFAAIYYSKIPYIKMSADEEIPIENVTFTPRNLLE